MLIQGRTCSPEAPGPGIERTDNDADVQSHWCMVTSLDRKVARSVLQRRLQTCAWCTLKASQSLCVRATRGFTKILVRSYTTVACNHLQAVIHGICLAACVAGLRHNRLLKRSTEVGCMRCRSLYVPHTYAVNIHCRRLLFCY